MVGRVCALVPGKIKTGSLGPRRPSLLGGYPNAPGETVDAALLLLPDQRGCSGTSRGISKRLLKTSVTKKQQPTPMSRFFEA